MVKVFAALIFLCLLSGCQKTSFQNIFSKHFNSGKEIIYSAPGDFNGDGKSEKIYISKSPEGKYYLKLKCRDKTYEALLNLDIKNFSAWVEDVDGNSKDDLILNSIVNDTPSLYIFTYDEKIKLLISPKIIENSINLKDITSYISSNYNNKGPISIDAKQATLFSTDIDIIPGESLFTCDYILSDENNSTDCISVSFTINRDGKINILDIYEFKNLPPAQ